MKKLFSLLIFAIILTACRPNDQLIYYIHEEPKYTRITFIAENGKEIGEIIDQVKEKFPQSEYDIEYYTKEVMLPWEKRIMLVACIYFVKKNQKIMAKEEGR